MLGVLNCPFLLLADETREEHAQELVKLAEQRLAEGKTEIALGLANIVIDKYPETRACTKAKEIKRLAGEKASSKSTTNAKSIATGEPDPAKACLWGFLPGGGQFYMGNYFRKVGNTRSANRDYFVGTGIAVSVPGYALLGAVGIAQSKDPFFDDNCIYDIYSCLFGDQCLQSYQKACLITGVVSLIAVPVLWGGGAFSAWSEARVVRSGDTIKVKLPRSLGF